VRFFILNSHYRSPLNYSDKSLDEAHAALTRLYTALRGLDRQSRSGFATPTETFAGNADLQNMSDGVANPVTLRMGEDFTARFEEAMQDDFNTPQAIAVLFDLAREINRHKTTDAAAARELAGVLKSLADVLGLLQEDPEAFLRGNDSADGLDAAAIEILIQNRLAARKAKHWADSDRIRDELKAQGIILEDSAQGTSWRRE
jgi:cysteinyl-tRNA synthetase